MKDKVLSQRRYLLVLPPPASFSTSGGALVATVERLNGTSTDSTEARNAAKHPSIPQERPTAGFLQTPEPAVLKARWLAWRGMVGQTQTGWD